MRELMILEAEHGVFLAREAEALGYDDKALRRARHDGLIVRVRRGAYVFAETWKDAGVEQRHLIFADAVMRTAQCRAVLSHTSAAVGLGVDVWDLPLDVVHLSRRDGRAGRREAGVVQHRGRLDDADVTAADGRLVTSPVRTALDLCTITDVEHALVVVNSILHEGLAAHEELLAAAEKAPFHPGSLTTGTVLRLADPRIESVGESRTWYALWCLGLPVPVPQYEVIDGSGRLLGRLDFAWPDLERWLEFDGREKYLKFLREGETVADAVVREKRREDLIRRCTGWTCIRITWADLANPAALARIIRSGMAETRVR